MLAPAQSEKALRGLFHRRPTAVLADLFRVLDTRSRMSVFRRLKALGYLSSFTHGGRYYTLEEIPSFDEWGLWFHRDVGFSRAGTLKAAVADLVQDSPVGMSPAELLGLLRLPVPNTLYNTLRELSGAERLSRQRLAGHPVYLSGETQRAEEQVRQRRRQGRRESVATAVASVDVVIAVLVEVCRVGQVRVAPSAVACRLTARGVAVTTEQVERILADNKLLPEKKRRRAARDARASAA